LLPDYPDRALDMVGLAFEKHVAATNEGRPRKQPRSGDDAASCKKGVDRSVAIKQPVGGVGAFDDLYDPFADFGEVSIEFGTGIAAVGESVPQPRIQGFDRFEHVGRPIPILNAGMMNDGADEVADCIGDDVALAPLDLLSGIKPALPAGGAARLAQGNKGASDSPLCRHEGTHC